jgi:hypothetical protein
MTDNAACKTPIEDMITNAIEAIKDGGVVQVVGPTHSYSFGREGSDAIAIRLALAKGGEPVAWLVCDRLYHDKVFLDRQQAQNAAEQRDMNSDIVPLYTSPVPAQPVDVDAEPSRDAIDAWLSTHCGAGIPFKDARDEASMLHGLAYVLRQIEGTNKYTVNIGQTGPATSALRMALDHFAIRALKGGA